MKQTQIHAGAKVCIFHEPCKNNDGKTRDLYIFNISGGYMPAIHATSYYTVLCYAFLYNVFPDAVFQ